MLHSAAIVREVWPKGRSACEVRDIMSVQDPVLARSTVGFQNLNGDISCAMVGAAAAVTGPETAQGAVTAAPAVVVAAAARSGSRSSPAAASRAPAVSGQPRSSCRPVAVAAGCVPAVVI